MSEFEEFLNLSPAEGEEPKPKRRSNTKRPKTEPRSRSDLKTKGAKGANVSKSGKVVPEPTWPAPIRPSMNFVPQKERDVEYARRAKRNGMLMVAGCAAVIAVWSGGLAVSSNTLTKDLKELVAAGDEAKRYLVANSEATTFYADFMDQRDAASKKFEAEVSPTKLLRASQGEAPKGVKINRVSFDDSGSGCGVSNPFSATATLGCLTIAGSTDNIKTLAQYTSAMSGDGSTLVNANYSEVKADGSKKTDFVLKAWYTQEALSGRAEGIAPTDEERALKVRQMVQLKQFQAPKEGAK